MWPWIFGGSAVALVGLYYLAPHFIIDAVTNLIVLSAGLKRKVWQRNRRRFTLLQCVSAGGFDWSYLIGGDAHKPILLLVHGFDADAANNWGPMAGKLRAHYRVIAPDLTGHGQTLPSSYCLLNAVLSFARSAEPLIRTRSASRWSGCTRSSTPSSETKSSCWPALQWCCRFACVYSVACFRAATSQACTAFGTLIVLSPRV